MLGSNPTIRLHADMVVHAAGRVPQIDDLNLDRAGVEWDKRGVRVNEFLQSVSNPGVYAAGERWGARPCLLWQATKGGL